MIAGHDLGNGEIFSLFYLGIKNDNNIMRPEKRYKNAQPIFTERYSVG